MRIGRLFAAIALCFVAVFRLARRTRRITTRQEPSRSSFALCRWRRHRCAGTSSSRRSSPGNFGQPFVIENKGGAGTIVAAVSTARAAPDGYTLMLATGSTMSINHALQSVAL